MGEPYGVTVHKKRGALLIQSFILWNSFSRLGESCSAQRGSQPGCNNQTWTQSSGVYLRGPDVCVADLQICSTYSC
jgi:hypothetical protein